jgi:hypothetical protein
MTLQMISSDHADLQTPPNNGFIKSQEKTRPQKREVQIWVLYIMKYNQI